MPCWLLRRSLAVWASEALWARAGISWGWWEGAVWPASCTPVALPFPFAPVLRICIPLLKHFSPGGIPTRNFKRNPRSGELEGESRRWQVLKHVYDED